MHEFTVNSTNKRKNVFHKQLNSPICHRVELSAIGNAADTLSQSSRLTEQRIEKNKERERKEEREKIKI